MGIRNFQIPLTRTSCQPLSGMCAPTAVWSGSSPGSYRSSRREPTPLHSPFGGARQPRGERPHLVDRDRHPNCPRSGAGRLALTGVEQVTVARTDKFFISEPRSCSRSGSTTGSTPSWCARRAAEPGSRWRCSTSTASAARSSRSTSSATPATARGYLESVHEVEFNVYAYRARGAGRPRDDRGRSTSRARTRRRRSAATGCTSRATTRTRSSPAAASTASRSTSRCSSTRCRR